MRFAKRPTQQLSGGGRGEGRRDGDGGCVLVRSLQRRSLVFLLHSAACCVPEMEGTDVEHDVTGADDEPLDR